MNFGEILNMVQTLAVNQNPAAVVLVEYKAVINRHLRALVSIAPEAPQLAREISVSTVPRITGTNATVRGGRREISFSTDIGLDRRYIDSFIKIASEQESYRVMDVDATGASANPHLLVDPPYIGQLDGVQATSQTFDILQMDYVLPRDCMRVTSIRTSRLTNRVLQQVELSDLEIRYPDPLIQGLIGSEPSVWADSGRTNYDFWSTDLDLQKFGVAGLLVLLNDDEQLLGHASTPPFLFTFLVSDRDTTSASHTSYLLGKDLFIEGDTRSYPISQFIHNNGDSDSAGDVIVLEGLYKGFANTGARYVIGQRGLRKIRVYPIPTSPTHLDVRYRRLPVDLVDDEDKPEIAEEHHHVLAMAAASDVILMMGGDSPAEVEKSARLQAKAEQGIANMFKEVNSLEGRPAQLRRAWSVRPQGAPRFTLPFTITATA